MGENTQSTTGHRSDVDLDDITIEDAVTRVEEIIDILEEGNVSLSKGKELHEEAAFLLNHIEKEVSLGDGELERVNAA